MMMHRFNHFENIFSLSSKQNKTINNKNETQNKQKSIIQRTNKKQTTVLPTKQNAHTYTPKQTKQIKNKESVLCWPAALVHGTYHWRRLLFLFPGIKCKQCSGQRHDFPFSIPGFCLFESMQALGSSKFSLPSTSTASIFKNHGEAKDEIFTYHDISSYYLQFMSYKQQSFNFPGLEYTQFNIVMFFKPKTFFFFFFASIFIFA